MLIQNKLNAENDLRGDLTAPIELIDERKTPGRTIGSNNIPQFLRNTIAVVAQHDKNKNVARAFGISQQEVSLIKNAKVPDGKDDFGRDRVNRDSAINTEIREAVGTDLLEVKKQATAKLLLALGCVSEERIKLIPRLGEVIAVAEGLSRIIERTTSKEAANAASEAKFVFIVPENRKTVRDYAVVEVENSLD